MNLEEYYKQYLKLHKNKNCRRMHVLGQLVTLSFVIAVCVAAFIYSSKYIILLLIIIIELAVSHTFELESFKIYVTM